MSTRPSFPIPLQLTPCTMNTISQVLSWWAEGWKGASRILSIRRHRRRWQALWLQHPEFGSSLSWLLSLTLTIYQSEIAYPLLTLASAGKLAWINRLQLYISHLLWRFLNQSKSILVFPARDKERAEMTDVIRKSKHLLGAGVLHNAISRKCSSGNVWLARAPKAPYGCIEH
jgi:hypothetical protein